MADDTKVAAAAPDPEPEKKLVGYEVKKNFGMIVNTRHRFWPAGEVVYHTEDISRLFAAGAELEAVYR